MTKTKKVFSIEKCINYILYAVLIFGVIPVFITMFMGRLKAEHLFLKNGMDEQSVIEKNLPEVIAKQINVNLPDEVLKAQCVIARTQMMAAEEAGEKLPAAFTQTELQELWGEQYESYYQKLERIVKETEGQTLQYNGKLIYAAYHKASAGNTRDMREYYDKSQMPYLKSAACHEDTTAKEYLKVFFWTKEEFAALCKRIFSEENAGADITILKRDSAGYVLEVKAGKTVYEGEEFRKKLSLPSACFEITMMEEDVRIVTMGQGHGFGLSQHMAEKMADEGKNYREILQYFYEGIVIAE